MIRYDMMGRDSDIKLVQIRNMQKKKNTILGVIILVRSPKD